MLIDLYNIPKRLTKPALDAMDARTYEEVKARLEKRGPDALFNTLEAAIHTGRSPRTLKRLYDAGVGPTPEKNPDITGKGAVNQHKHYVKSALDLFRVGGSAFTTAFSSRFIDFSALTEEQPWVAGEGRLFCHLMDVGDVDEIMEILAEGLVEFYRLDEALLERWAALSLRNIYQDQFKAVIERWFDDIASAEQKDTLLLDTTGVSQQGVRNPL